MADNVTVDNGALTDFTVAARDSGGVYFHRHELVSFASIAAGVQTTVSSSAVQIIAADSTRVGLIVQNVGSVACRVGPSGVTATTGVKVDAGQTLALDGPSTPTNAVYAIRDGASDTTVLTQGITR